MFHNNTPIALVVIKYELPCDSRVNTTAATDNVSTIVIKPILTN